jgi:protein-S-isoprenylcysteine O-methyltransferase Ste14
MLAFWVAGDISQGRFLFAAVCTGFILFTVYLFEEPTLVDMFGDEYSQYQKSTGAFCPMLVGKGSGGKAKKKSN